jgi:hypothetical protein
MEQIKKSYDVVIIWIVSLIAIITGIIIFN